MFRPLPLCAILVALLGFSLFAPETTSTQLIDSIGSEHVRLRMPADRDSLGRDLAGEIERCYLYMNRTTGQSLPRKILIIADWSQAESSCNLENAIVTIGMNQPAASANVKGFLLHNAAREMARLGLLELSGGAKREDTEFLFEGMIEIIAREYEHTSRSLEGAWVICKYLDEMKQLGLSTQRSWEEFSDGKRCFRTAAPGITLLETYRELQGRDIFLKLFEGLKKKSLSASLTSTFKATTTEIENTWLQKVRDYKPAEEITTSPEDIPELTQTTLLPGSVKAGNAMEMQLYLKDRYNNLLPNGIYVRDERTGRLLQPDANKSSGGYAVVNFPIEANCPPGDYRYQITVVDESGNLRQWSAGYKVVP